MIDRRGFLTATVSLAALLAACGSDDDGGGASPTSGAGTTAPPGTRCSVDVGGDGGHAPPRPARR